MEVPVLAISETRSHIVEEKRTSEDAILCFFRLVYSVYRLVPEFDQLRFKAGIGSLNEAFEGTYCDVSPPGSVSINLEVAIFRRTMHKASRFSLEILMHVMEMLSAWAF